MLVLLLLGLAAGVHGTCDSQYQNQTYNPLLNGQKLWIMNSYDETLGQYVDTSCTIYLNSNDSSYGIGNYTQIFWDSTVTGNISIYNSDATGAILSPIKIGINQTITSLPCYSTGQYVTVVITTSGNGAVIASMDVGSTANHTICSNYQPTTSAPTTTAAPYTGPGINPILVSHDLVIMVDTGKNTPANSTDLTDSQNWASAVVDELRPSVFGQMTSDQTPVTGTRLTLNQLNLLGSGPLFLPWEADADQVSRQIRNLAIVPSQKTVYSDAIQQFAQDNTYFNPKNGSSKYQPSRNTAQRTLLVVSTAAPTPTDVKNLATVDLTTFDVHPIFVAFNYDATPLASLTSSTSKWTVVSASNTTVPADFVNQYFRSKGAGNILCSQPETLQYNATTANVTVNWPSTLPDDFPSSPNYKTNRYCNFQKFSIIINKNPNQTKLCFIVKHETEADKDTLKFYQQNIYSKWDEVVSVSGIDVQGTAFKLTNNTRIDFETNESQVFGGFQVQFNSCT